MLRRNAPLAAALLASVGVPLAALGGEYEMSPAHVGDGKKAIFNLIEFPESQRTSGNLEAAVNCQIIISKRGRADGSR